MKKIILFIVGFLYISPIWGQDILNLSTGQISANGNTSPIRIVNQYEDCIIVSYDFSFAKIIEDDLLPGTIWWHYDGFSTNNTPGEAALPVKLDSFVFPDSSTISVSVVESSYVDFYYELTPARQPLIDSGNEFYTPNNIHSVSLYDGFMPISIVDDSDVQIYRNSQVQNIRIFPIKYDSTNKIVRAYTHIKYKITFDSNYTNSTNSFLSNENNIFLSLPNEFISPFNQFRQDYLIITTNEYSNAALRFGEWKKLLGFNVHTAISDTWNPDSIKNIVQNTYHEFPDLRYLLIIGDHEDVPGNTSTLETPHITDLYYGCLNGENDYTPELSRGRISVSSLDEANIVIDKIINYEKNPPTKTSFYNTGLNCAYFQDNNNDGYANRRFAETSEDIRNYLVSLGKCVERVYYTEPNINPTNWNRKDFSNGDTIPFDLLKPNFAWDGDSADILNAINDGRFYVLHRDHGNPTSWGSPNFGICDINQLSNENLLPIVFSINCETGKFDYNNGICFTEAFLRKQNGGSVAIFGATANSYSGYNDAMAIGMFDAIWNIPGLRVEIGRNCPLGDLSPLPSYRLGDILDRGLYRMRKTYGARNTIYSKYHCEIFHCFGDPSMRIYTSQPTEFSNVEISREQNFISVNLNDTVANITFYNHRTGDVICYRNSEATYYTEFPNFVTVCISEHNKIPYIDNGVVQTNIYIQNETISSDKNYDADFIAIGSNVTDAIPYGDVYIQNGNVTMSASEYLIQPNFSISSQANISITIK